MSPPRGEATPPDWPETRDRPPIPEGDHDADEFRMTAAAPTVTRPVGRRPVTRLVIRIWDRSPRTSSERKAFSVSVTDAPGTSWFDRGVACHESIPGAAWGQWHPGPLLPATMVGRTDAPNPGRMYQVRAGTGPSMSSSRPSSASTSDSGYAVAMPRSLRSGFLALGVLLAIAGCSSGADLRLVRSDHAVHRRRTLPGRLP